MFRQSSAQSPPPRQAVIQPQQNKRVALLPTSAKPVAPPPVYRPSLPQPVAPPTYQFSPIAGSNVQLQESRRFIENRPAPPVYRPQSPVLLRKAGIPSGAPPVYRPFAPGVVAPSVYRPGLPGQAKIQPSVTSARPMQSGATQPVVASKSYSFFPAKPQLAHRAMNFPKPIQRSAIPAAAHAVSKLGITGVIQRSTLIVSVDKDMDPSVGGHVRRLLKSNVNATVVDIDTMNQKPLSADQLKGVDKLYFVAHGYGDMIGDMWSAEQVKNLLLTNETKKVWQVKQFILVACNSANEKYTSMEQPKTFAELLHADLSSEANVPLTLVAPSGFGYTDIEGRLRVVPLEKQTEYMKKVKELDKIKQSNPQEYVRQAKALLDEYAPVGTGLKTFSSELPMTETLPLLHNQTSSDEEDVSCSCWPFWPFTLCFSK